MESEIIGKTWYEDGQLQSENIFDKETGKPISEKWWYKNGQLEFENIYDKETDKLISEKWWYEDGQPKSEKIYDKETDKLISEKWWYKNGQLDGSEGASEGNNEHRGILPDRVDSGLDCIEERPA